MMKGRCKHSCTDRWNALLARYGTKKTGSSCMDLYPSRKRREREIYIYREKER